MAEFDESKQYGGGVFVHNKNDIDMAKEMLRNNMKLFVPKKFQGFVTYPVAHYKAISCLKPECWGVSWIYNKVG